MKNISDFAACLWAVLMRSFFIIIVVAVGHFAFVINDQGQDLVLALSEKGNWSAGVLFLFGAVILWSIACWYSTRILFQLKDLSFVYKKEIVVHSASDLPQFSQTGNSSSTPYIIDEDRKKRIEDFIKWTPRIFGLIPFLIWFFAFRKQSELIEDSSFLIWAYVIIVVSGTMMIVFYSYRKKLIEILKLPVTFLPNRFAADPLPRQKLLRNKSLRNFLIVVFVVFLFFLMIFGFPIGSVIAAFFGPGAIVLIGLTMFTCLLALLSYWNNWKKKPVFVILLGWIMLCGLWNDNTILREEHVTTKKRETIEDHFHQWVKYHQPTDSNQSVIPLIIIAAEGGGIRALNWTASVLRGMEEDIAGFPEHVFAISGVSGGGVGSSFYLSYYRDKLKNNGMGNVDFSTMPFDTLLSADYLSSVTAGLLFPDNLQRVLPWNWNSLNRTRRLEDAWSQEYNDLTTLHTWDHTFLRIWDLEDSLRYRLPSLFLNGTLAETGQKAIASNLAWKKDSTDTVHHFFDIIDVEEKLGETRDLPFKTAVSLCARFPGVTTGGLLIDSTGQKIGHIVDGGYAENTGLETAIAVYATLYNLIRVNNADPAKTDIKVYMLFIKNSKTEDSDKIIKGIMDINVPLNAFFNAWGRGAIPTHQTTHDLINHSSLDTLISHRSTKTEDIYYKIELNRKGKVHLPLGWYLSDQARRELKAQSNSLNSPKYSSYQKFVSDVKSCFTKRTSGTIIE